MKTLVRMKSTQLGKDDDSPLTLKYNEGCECRIGPDLLKAFKDLKAVEILKEKEQKPAKKEKNSSPEGTNEDSEIDDPEDTNEDLAKTVESPEKKGGRKKKK